MTIHNELEVKACKYTVGYQMSSQNCEADAARAEGESRQEAIKRRFDETNTNIETKFKGMEEQLGRELSESLK